MVSANLAELAAAQTVRAYYKSSVDQFVIAAQNEREKLRAALDRANARRLAAEQRVADAKTSHERLSTLVENTQRLVQQLKHENQRAVAAILAAAEAEADAILAMSNAEAMRLQAGGFNVDVTEHSGDSAWAPAEGSAGLA